MNEPARTPIFFNAWLRTSSSPRSTLRADPSVLAANRLGQSALWQLGISGDRPIVLVRIAARDELPLTRELLAAQAYLRQKGLETDLVLLVEEPASDEGELSRRLPDLIRAAGSQERMNEPGGVFVRKAAQLIDDEKILLQAVARVVLIGDRGSLDHQLDRTDRRILLPAACRRAREPHHVGR